MSIQLEDINDPISRAFERQADLHAARPAIHTSEHSLTYGQLEAFANRVANELLARRGDSPEPVPLVVAEPALMLGAALGVLKAGKFYVPVNPHFPAARVQLLMEDVNPALVMCDGSGRAALEATPHGREVAQLEDILAGRGAEDRPGAPIEPERFAYILYTSGSTGRPKGVAQTHRNVLHNIFRHNALGVGPDDTVTLLSADGFIGAVSNPYMALLNGASLAAYSFRHDGVDGALDWLNARRVTVYYSFPSFFRQVAAAATQPPPNQSMRLVYFGGEQVFPSDLAAARSLFPAATVSVGLNSTETGLTRLLMLAPEDAIPQNVLPVGGPVEGVEVKILDEAGRELEGGGAGEIAVVSPYIYPRYWRDGAAAAAANGDAAADPDEPHVFRTGDRGYIDDRGGLVHLGRLDSMVKVRGYRVELSEVESALNALPGVKEAAVVPHASTPEEVELVAYVVSSEPNPDGRGVRRRLAEVLPEPMLPSSLVFVGSLPRTSNGKVDRRALPAPGAAPETPAPSPGDAPEGQPLNPFEEGVARIWGRALSADKIGVSDNFFQVGGHSVMAVRVVTAIRKEFNVPLPLQVIFKTPTIKALAEEIARLRAEKGQPEEVGTK
ncbi:MAG TPA: non-ribosomal peptide synthetase [Pyrinomonadaceae bacterium]|jgi:peptide synthetase PhsA